MALTGTRTYVGFGFGAIQAGLFLYEAFQSGAFRRLVVAEVVPDVVASVRGNGGYFIVNIARPDGVEREAACVERRGGLDVRHERGDGDECERGRDTVSVAESTIGDEEV